MFDPNPRFRNLLKQPFGSTADLSRSFSTLRGLRGLSTGSLLMNHGVFMVFQDSE